MKLSLSPLLSLLLASDVSAFSAPSPVAAAAKTTSASGEEKSRTQRIMESTNPEGQTGGAGGSSTYDAFVRAEQNWARLKASREFKYDPKLLGSGVPSAQKFVTMDGGEGNPQCWAKLREQEGKYLDYDVSIIGGTLGIFFATALALKGHKVCVLEAGELKGREQEWNISMDEMEELVELGVLTQEDVDAVIMTEFPGCRSGFKNLEVTPLAGGYFENGQVGYECNTPDVLNLGVAPSILLERVKKTFLSLGGTIKEQTRLQGVVISESLGSALDLGESDDPVTSRLVLDCMGNASPISRQQRYGMKPDGVCAVVGSCASGFEKETNLVGDIIYTNSQIQDKGENGQYQYFWEAFPVGVGRSLEPGESDTKTTYMFTYMDADRKRVSLETLMEDYFDMLPLYQPEIKNPETDLDFKRVLFAFFPTYRDSPLKPEWSRLLAVGDASGIQVCSALSMHTDEIFECSHPFQTISRL